MSRVLSSLRDGKHRDAFHRPEASPRLGQNECKSSSATASCAQMSDTRRGNDVPAREHAEADDNGSDVDTEEGQANGAPRSHVKDWDEQASDDVVQLLARYSSTPPPFDQDKSQPEGQSDSAPRVFAENRNTQEAPEHNAREEEEVDIPGLLIGEDARAVSFKCLEDRAQPKVVCFKCNLARGYGIVLEGRAPVVLSAVKHGSPAYMGGARTGDRCVAVNGVTVLHLSKSAVGNLLKSCDGEYVKLQLLPRDDNCVFPVLGACPRWNFRHIDPFGFDVRDLDDVDGLPFVLDPKESFPVTTDPTEPIVPNVILSCIPAQCTEASTETVDESPLATADGAKSVSQQQHRGEAAPWSTSTLHDVTAPPLEAFMNSNDASYVRTYAAFFEHRSSGLGPTVHLLDIMPTLLQGIPHHLRPHLWFNYTRAATLKSESPLRYEDICTCAYHANQDSRTAHEIEKDLLRTFPRNVFFASLEMEGIIRLRRVLMASAWHRPDVGYCQGIGMVAANLLLLFEEADAFWMLQAVMSALVSDDFYGSKLLGSMAEQYVLSDLVSEYIPNVIECLDQYDLKLVMVTLNWYLTAFAGVADARFTLRIWDMYLLEGVNLLTKVVLAMISTQAQDIEKNKDNPGELMQILASIPQRCSKRASHVPQPTSPSSTAPSQMISGLPSYNDILSLAFSFQIIEDKVPALRRKHRESLQRYHQQMQRLRDGDEGEEGDVGGLLASANASLYSMALSKWTGGAWLGKFFSDGQVNPLMDAKAVAVTMEQLGEVVMDLMIAAHEKSADDLTMLVHHSFCKPLVDVLRSGLCLPHVWDFFEACMKAILANEVDWDKSVKAGDIRTVSELRMAAVGLAAAVDSVKQLHNLGQDQNKEIHVRSVICRGLNGGYLDAWFYVLHICASLCPSTAKHYRNGAIMKSRMLCVKIENYLVGLSRNARFNLACDIEAEGGAH